MVPRSKCNRGPRLVAVWLVNSRGLVNAPLRFVDEAVIISILVKERSVELLFQVEEVSK